MAKSENSKDLFSSILDDTLGGIARAFAAGIRGSKSDSSSPRGRSRVEYPESPDDYLDDDYDDDDDPSTFYSQTSATTSTLEDIPEPIRPAVQQLQEALGDKPNIQPDDILNFCSDERNWPFLKLMMQIGIAAVGLTVILALFGAYLDSHNTKNTATAEVEQDGGKKPRNRKDSRK